MQGLSSCGELILQDLLYNMQPVGRIWVCCIILNLKMHLAKESAHLICIHFSMAEVLSIAENFNINGTISSEIGTLSKLRELILQRTHISGTVPSEVGLLSNLGNYHCSFLLAPWRYNFIHLLTRPLNDSLQRLLVWGSMLFSMIVWQYQALCLPRLAIARNFVSYEMNSYQDWCVSMIVQSHHVCSSFITKLR